jgi:hypothetical protein
MARDKKRGSKKKNKEKKKKLRTGILAKRYGVLFMVRPCRFVFVTGGGGGT